MSRGDACTLTRERSSSGAIGSVSESSTPSARGTGAAESDVSDQACPRVEQDRGARIQRRPGRDDIVHHDDVSATQAVASPRGDAEGVGNVVQTLFRCQPSLRRRCT